MNDLLKDWPKWALVVTTSLALAFAFVKALDHEFRLRVMENQAAASDKANARVEAKIDNLAGSLSQMQRDFDRTFGKGGP